MNRDMTIRDFAKPLAAYAAVIGTLSALAYGAPTHLIVGWVTGLAAWLIAWHVRGHRDTERLADLVQVLQQEKATSAELAEAANTYCDRNVRLVELLAASHVATSDAITEAARLRADITRLLEKSL